MNKLSKVFLIVVSILVMTCCACLSACAEPVHGIPGTHRRIILTLPDDSSLHGVAKANPILDGAVIDIKSSHGKDMYILEIRTDKRSESLIYGTQSKNGTRYLAGSLMGNEAFEFTSQDIENILNSFISSSNSHNSLNAKALTDLLFTERSSDSLRIKIHQAVLAFLNQLKNTDNAQQITADNSGSQEHISVTLSLHPDIAVGLLSDMYPWIPENFLNGLFHYLQDYGTLQITYIQDSNGIPLSVNIHAEKEGPDPEDDPVHSVEKELDIEYNYQNYGSQDDYTVCANIHGFDENNLFVYLYFSLENDSVDQFYISTDVSWGNTAFSLNARTMSFENVRSKSSPDTHTDQNKYIVIHPEINNFDHYYMIRIADSKDSQNTKDIFISKDDNPYLQIFFAKEEVDDIKETQPEYFKQLTTEQVQIFLSNCINFLSQAQPESEQSTKGGN